MINNLRQKKRYNLNYLLGLLLSISLPPCPPLAISLPIIIIIIKITIISLLQYYILNLIHIALLKCVLSNERDTHNHFLHKIDIKNLQLIKRMQEEEENVKRNFFNKT